MAFVKGEAGTYIDPFFWVAVSLGENVSPLGMQAWSSFSIRVAKSP